MPGLNRRRFLEVSAALAAAAPLPAAEPDLRFPTRPRDRMAVASYPFRAFMDTPNNRNRGAKEPLMDLKAFASMVLERFHVRNIESLYSHFSSTEPAYLRDLRAAFEKAGVHVVNIPVSVSASLYDPDAARREMGVGNAKHWIDAAVLLGAPGIRVHIQGVQGVAPDVARTAECLKAIADYGAANNVIVNLENDSLLSEDAFFLVRVMDQVNHPYLRALPDFGNSMLSGSEAFDYDALAVMFRHAYHICHVKDVEVENGKVFRVDLGKSFALARAAGFRGYFSMEFEGQGEPYEGTRKLLEASLKWLR